MNQPRKKQRSRQRIKVQLIPAIGGRRKDEMNGRRE